MAKKLKPRELSALQDEYLLRREQILVNKVDTLSTKLFDKVFNSYLNALEQNGGKLVSNSKNIDLVKGLDSIYKIWNKNDNIPIIKSFVTDLQGITPLNERYFSTLMQRSIGDRAALVNRTINGRLGISEGGVPQRGGFVDKFIRDEQLLKKIKKETNKALTNGTGFQEFRGNLKTLIEGNPEQQLSGGLQQYYRNYAYDTYMQVDRDSADLFAKELELRYWYWTGGVITTSRTICIECNGKIMDGHEWKKVTDFKMLKPQYRDGMDKNSNPSKQLGCYGCRHRKRYVLDSVAVQTPEKIIDIKKLLT